MIIVFFLLLCSNAGLFCYNVAKAEIEASWTREVGIRGEISPGAPSALKKIRERGAGICGKRNTRLEMCPYPQPMSNKHTDRVLVWRRWEPSDGRVRSDGPRQGSGFNVIDWMLLSPLTSHCAPFVAR
jgi:hypothetical protein